MFKQLLFIILLFIILAGKSNAQNYIITQPRLEIEGNQVLISYDIIAKNVSDKFYIWIEVKKSDGEKINATALSGDVGADIQAGNNKKIIWDPERDSVFLNEDIFVNINAEKYIKSFNKGSMVLKSAIFPGWGQTKISQGKPWWLLGAAVYGTMAGGYLYHKKYHKSYESYKNEEDPLIRADLLEQSEKQLKISKSMIYSATAVWALNVVWVALIPDRYQPLQHMKLSIKSSQDLYNKGVLLSLKFDF